MPNTSASASTSMPPASRHATTSPAWQTRLAHLGFALLLLSLTLRFLLIVRHRTIDFDQFCTLVTARAHTWHTWVVAVVNDSQPLSDVLVRISLALPFPQAISLHLFSFLAIALAALCLFRLFSRRGAHLAGLCAAAYFTSSRCVEFMLTLRPYALLMAVSALSVLVYDTYSTRRSASSPGPDHRRTTSRPATLWPLALVIVLGATVHALGMVYVLAPIAAGELLHWRTARRSGTYRPDTRLLRAVALASTAFVFDFALAHQVQQRLTARIPLAAKRPNLPTLAKLHELLTWPFERQWQVALFVLVLAATLVLWRRSSNSAINAGSGLVETQSPAEKHPTSSPTSRAGNVPSFAYPLAAAAALWAAALLAFTMGLANHYFFTRYAAPVFIAAALLLGSALSLTPWRKLPAVPLLLAAALLLLPLPKLRSTLRAESGSPQQQLADFPALFHNGEIFASPLAMPVLWWYSTPEQRPHLHLLTDPALSLTTADALPENLLRNFAADAILPFALTPYSTFHPGPVVTLVQPLAAGDAWLPPFFINGTTPAPPTPPSPPRTTPSSTAPTSPCLMNPMHRALWRDTASALLEGIGLSSFVEL